MLAIRHFEKLSNTEAALVLDVSEPAAGMRYLRALRRLKKQLRQHADLSAMSLNSSPSETGATRSMSDEAHER